MDILQYFVFENGQYSHYKFDSTKIADLINELPKVMRQCYVEDKDIEKVLTSTVDASTVVKTYIPDKPHIKSGEFGEILSFTMLLQKYLPIELTGIKKWQLKPDKNKASFYTDLVLYSCSVTPSPEDLLVCAEVKTKAKSAKNNRIQEAIEGAEKDYVSRLGDTLAYLKDKSIQKGDSKTVKDIERFQDSIEDGNGVYRKHVKAILVIDSNLCDDEVKKKVVIKEVIEDFEIVVICMDNLKALYEQVYQKMPDSYQE